MVQRDPYLMDRQSSTADFAPDWSPIAYELRIGVTGNRELTDPAAVSAKVRELLEALVSVLEEASADPYGPHGSPQSLASRLDRRLAEALGFLWLSVPVSPRRPDHRQRTSVKLTAISSLAPGADQIVTRAVCDVVRKQPIGRNRFVEAVLPFPQSIYEQDFATSEDLWEFRALLALDCGAYNTHPQPMVCFPQFEPASDPSNPTDQFAREEAYAAAGRHVVDTSEVLIAIWNPTREGGLGGTEDTIREALDRGRVVLWLNPERLDDGVWALRPKEPVRSAKAAKRGRSAWDARRRPPEAGHFCTVAPVPTRAKELALNFHRLAAYNRDAAVNQAELDRAWQHEMRKLTAHASRCALPGPVLQVLVENLLPRLVRADLLSRRYQRLRDAAAHVWPISAALVVTLMAFQVLFLPLHYWLAWVELAVLAVGYVSNRVSAHEAWHEKWLNDRRLAEGLRSATYAVLAGHDIDGTNAATSHTQTLPFYDPANTWYVASMKREVAKGRRRFGMALSMVNPDQRGAVRCVLLDAWVRPQALHHRKNAEEHRRRSKRAKWIRLGVFALIVAVAAAHAVGVGHDDGETAGSLRDFDLWLGFFTVALPAWAAAFHAMLSLDDHERLAERSERMATLLEGLVERLASAQTVADISERVAEAERIMDLESAEWAESLIDRRPEFTA